ncbi:MAG: DUF4041 domain-containing protein [Chitinispirillia bacterium]|nr:DUF4041 domain-containing protein [Chitinispirillia bacterium]MCL2268582.1 DUF4041 domain-containing protein [Chitinispirillia bacterium]
MSLFGLKEKKEIEQLTATIEALKARLTPEQQRIDVLREEIKKLEEKKVAQQTSITYQDGKLKYLRDTIEVKSAELILVEEEVLLQSFGLYTPKYEFSNAEAYKAELERIRTRQKELIKTDLAVTGNANWTVDGSAAKGKKMLKDMQKLLLRAFNGECDEIVARVKYSNFDASLKRITSSREAISKLGQMMRLEITDRYYNAKIDELRLALEYQQKKQQEKEDQKAIREQMREEAKLQREIEELRKKAEKEQSHYENALLKLNAQIDNASEAERDALLAKKQEIEAKLEDVEKAIKDVDYRAANQRAGYVYVISNIGAFGENVYKIGMTRRLDPQERVDELGDASVPFDFDIHAMIFCEDAPALEAALHRAFEGNKLNWVNTRREFFNVSLNDIKQVVKANYDKTVEFIEHADAEQFRTSMRMREQSVAA